MLASLLLHHYPTHVQQSLHQVAGKPLRILMILHVSKKKKRRVGEREREREREREKEEKEKYFLTDRKRLYIFIKKVPTTCVHDVNMPRQNVNMAQHRHTDILGCDILADYLMDNTIIYIYFSLTVTLEECLEVMWKKSNSSLAIMYDTP